jgi:diaminopimelate epimerase
LKFVKMHGAGNDFLVVDGREVERDWGWLARSMCQRHFGAGADGLLVAVRPREEQARMRLFNADGSEAENSGNGVRCFAKYAVEWGLAEPSDGRLRVETGAGLIVLDLVMDGATVAGARVDMGPPRFAPAEIPVAVEQSPPVLDLPLQVDGRTITVTCVSMGNPHAVHFTADAVSEFPLAEMGPAIEHHALFPARVNFEVARVLDRGHIESRTWERGVGETMACGTGASAIMVSARLHGWVDSKVEVREPGGVLTLEWDRGGSVFLTGPAAFVYSGEWPD